MVTFQSIKKMHKDSPIHLAFYKSLILTAYGLYLTVHSICLPTSAGRGRGFALAKANKVKANVFTPEYIYCIYTFSLLRREGISCKLVIYFLKNQFHNSSLMDNGHAKSIQYFKHQDSLAC